MSEHLYNLLDEPWLPVRLVDGRVLSVGLLEVMARSAEVAALAETAPPSLVAQYRLLLAITHRALTGSRGRWSPADRASWHREGLPLAEIAGYLETWRERFWLFHPEHPFLQVAALATAEETRDKRKPWTQISLASANGNAPIVFDHACDIDPSPISPAQAIGLLLGFLQFTPGGLVKALRDADKAGPLVNTAATIPLGSTLAKTLCLALHPPPSSNRDPDLPAWERDPVAIDALSAEPSIASGPNDRYTRQSRAVLFQRDDDNRIRWLRFAAGVSLAEDPVVVDPMVSYRVGVNGPVRLTFREGRAVWRDLAALVPTPGGETRPAPVLEYALALHGCLSRGEVVYQPLLIAGLASDQAKLLRWRSVRIELPSALLRDCEKAASFLALVGDVETLWDALRSLATSMLAETYPDPRSKDARARARTHLDNGAFTEVYFAQAERALPDLMQMIADDELDNADQLWRKVLRQCARSAWNCLRAGMGQSPAALKVDAKYWGRWQSVLNERAPDPALESAEEA